jgi:hypothetical protein
VLHQVVREHLLSFLAEGAARSESGEGYPLYVEKELRDFLGCGEMSRGFARVRCGACGHELLLPFSCKNRGVCPSCTARRMSEEAAYLVDLVLPEARYRQWTVTFPWAIRALMARDYRLITAGLGIVVRALCAWQRRQARRAGHREAKTATVAFVQRFGGALNLNVHLHLLLPDAVFVDGGEQTLALVPVPPPGAEDLRRLLARIARRVTSMLERRYANVDDDGSDVLAGAIAEAMTRRPRPRLEIGAAAAGEDVPEKDEQRRRARRCVAMDSFSLHAGTTVAAHNRLGLEKLCRYGMRPPFAQERLRLTTTGQVHLELRRPWPTPDGASVLRFAPVDFLRRLAPLIPPPYAHLIRYFGLLAPNAKQRDRLPPAPLSWTGIRPAAFLRGRGRAAPPADAAPDTPPSANAPLAVTPAPGSAGRGCPSTTVTASDRPRRQRLTWAELLRRVFAVDVLVCQKCLGPMTVIATLTDPAVLEKILVHLGLPTAPLPLAPAKGYGQLDLLEDGEELGDAPRDKSRQLAWSSRQQAGAASSRGPPEEGDGTWILDPEVMTGQDDWGD